MPDDFEKTRNKKHTRNNKLQRNRSQAQNVLKPELERMRAKKSQRIPGKNKRSENNKKNNQHITYLINNPLKQIIWSEQYQSLILTNYYNA